MATFDSQELLEEYVKWQAEKKVVGVDTSPTAFLIDRAKEAAYGILENIEEYATGLQSGDYGGGQSPVDIGDYLREILGS